MFGVLNGEPWVFILKHVRIVLLKGKREGEMMRGKLICGILMNIALVFSGNYIAQASGSGSFRVETPDAGAFGKGTSFIGEANTPAAVYYNPAGITQIDGFTASFGLSAIQPRTSYESPTGNEQDMRVETFYIPNFYAVNDFGSERWAFGFGMGSNWGLTTDWESEGFSRYNNTRTELTNIDAYFVAAYDITDQWTLAGSIDRTSSKASLEKKLFQGPGISDGDFQIKGDDIVTGYRLAGMYKLNDRHHFGLVYRSENKLNLDGTLTINGLENSSFLQGALGADYSQIFGGGDFSTPAKGEIILPRSVALGYSYRPDPKWVFNFDIEWFDWSSTENLHFTFPEVTSSAQQQILSSGNPISKDWNDAISASCGLEYAWNDYLRLRAGYYFHENVIPEANWDPSIPDANSHAVTMGFGYDFSENATIDFAYSFMYYDYKDFIDSNVTDGFGITDIDGKYNQYINLALISFTMDFDEIFDKYAYR